AARLTASALAGQTQNRERHHARVRFYLSSCKLLYERNASECRARRASVGARTVITVLSNSLRHERVHARPPTRYARACRTWRGRRLLLRLGRKLQRIALAAAGFRSARGLGFGYVARIDGDNADAAPMRRHHHPIGLVLAHTKLALEHRDDELARSVVVVEQDDLVQPRPFRLKANLSAPLGGDVAHCSNASRSRTSFSHVREGACNSREAGIVLGARRADAKTARDRPAQASCSLSRFLPV